MYSLSLSLSLTHTHTRLGTGLENWNISRVTSFENTFQDTSRIDDCVRARVYDRWSSNLNFNNYNLTWVQESVAVSCLACSFHGPRWLSYRVTEWIESGNTSPCGDIADWDVSQVTDMANLFCHDDTSSRCDSTRSNFDGAGISNWDVSGVTDMSKMFYGATGFTEDISTWDVRNVRTFQAAFDGNAASAADICM